MSVAFDACAPQSATRLPLGGEALVTRFVRGSTDDRRATPATEWAAAAVEGVDGGEPAPAADRDASGADRTADRSAARPQAVTADRGAASPQAVVTDAAARASYGRFAGLLGIVCNVLLSLLKGAAGLLAGSVAVVADAANNLTDAASSVVSLVGFKLASRPADEGHPFGHGRSEYIAGSVVAVLVLVVGLELMASSVRKLLNPEPTSFDVPVLIVLAVCVVVKLWMMRMNDGIGLRIGSAMLHATAIDARNDAIATTAVLVAAVVTRLTGVDLDGWAGLGVGAFIVASGIGLVRESASTLLGSAPDADEVERIRARILGYEGVLGTHDLMVHDYGPGRRFASAHVEVAAENDVIASHDLIDRIEQDFYREEGIEMTLHMDPIVTMGGQQRDLRTEVASAVRTVDPRLTVHDVRILSSDGLTSASFDCERPADLALDDDELAGRILAAMAGACPDVLCRVTIDPGYLQSARSDAVTVQGRPA